MLKTVIPESVWSEYRCLVVHPGPQGDRGPSSLDWAIELQAREWGVTVLEANDVLDGGDVWATRTFPMREAGKSSLYRHEVRRAAIEALVEAVTAIQARPRGAGPPAANRRHRAPLLSASADRLVQAHDRDDHPPDPRRRGSPWRPRRRVSPVRRAPRVPAARRARPDHRPAPRRDLPRDGRRRRLDQPPQAPGALQAPRHPRARAGGTAGDRARGRRRLPRDHLRGARGRRLPALRLLQRRDEHRPVPAAARRLPRGPRARHARAGADGRHATSSAPASTST